MWRHQNTDSSDCAPRSGIWSQSGKKEFGIGGRGDDDEHDDGDDDDEHSDDDDDDDDDDDNNDDNDDVKWKRT